MQISSTVLTMTKSCYGVLHVQLIRNVGCKSFFNSILGSKPYFGLKWIGLLNVLPWLAFFVICWSIFPPQFHNVFWCAATWFHYEYPIFSFFCYFGSYLSYDTEGILSADVPPPDIPFCFGSVLHTHIGVAFFNDLAGQNSFWGEKTFLKRKNQSNQKISVPTNLTSHGNCCHFLV